MGGLTVRAPGRVARVGRKLGDALESEESFKLRFGLLARDGSPLVLVRVEGGDVGLEPRRMFEIVRLLRIDAALDRQVAALAEREQVPPFAVRLVAVEMVNRPDSPLGHQNDARHIFLLQCPADSGQVVIQGGMNATARFEVAERTIMPALTIARRPLTLPVLALAVRMPASAGNLYFMEG